MRVCQGNVEPGFEPVARLFDRLFRVAGRGGGSFVLRHRDRVLVDIWGGVADPATGTGWRRDTLALSFSTTKGVAATVIHRLADRGLLGYDDPVAAFWPEFAAGGKERITVRQLLRHQAGLDRLAPIAPDPDSLLDHLAAERRLAAQRPDHRPGTSAYHAITFGWLCAGLARAITGKGMAELVRTELAEPLGVDGLHIGRPPRAAAAERASAQPDRERVAATIGELRPMPGLLARFVALPFPITLPHRRIAEAMLSPGVNEIFRPPCPPVLDTEMPAANGVFTAESLATLYGALANGGAVNGRRLLSGATVHDLARPPRSRVPDLALGFPMYWRLGYHQAFVPGLRMPTAFGHYGYAGSGAWADPASGLSAAFVSNRVYPLSNAMGDLALVRLSRLSVRVFRALQRPGALSA